MDFSQLSKETLELSEQIGAKQMQLLFDENYFCEEISLESSPTEEVSSGLVWHFLLIKVLAPFA